MDAHPSKTQHAENRPSGSAIFKKQKRSTTVICGIANRHSQIYSGVMLLKFASDLAHQMGIFTKHQAKGVS